MGNEKLLQYIASLSDEELEKHKDIIKESLQRDRVLEENFSHIKIYIEDIAANIKLIQEKALQLQEDLSVINETLVDAGESSQIISRLISSGPVWN